MKNIFKKSRCVVRTAEGMTYCEGYSAKHNTSRVYVHKALDGEGWTATSFIGGMKIAGAKTREKAYIKAIKRIDLFNEKHGDRSFERECAYSVTR